MVNIEIDGQSYAVQAGDNLLKACLELGLDLPYFCWHPALGSVGACRQCAVIQYLNPEDPRGRVAMACMTQVADGLRVAVQSQQARDFRAGIIELLMTNHPHDCPVCEEGGECHLQDMTEMTGHTSRQYRGNKRTHRNQQLGPFINHEMNRCIACYRCVRYYQDYCGGHDLQVFAAHNQVYFGRHEDGALENEFSGNLVEVCPTGVFTDKTFSRHFTRKWDLQTTPSVCAHCALGCNTSPGERYGSLRRVANRYHGEVNGYFLCDRGRFGYEFVNGGQRVRQCQSRSGFATPTGTFGAANLEGIFAGRTDTQNVSDGVANPVTQVANPVTQAERGQTMEPFAHPAEFGKHFADLVRTSAGVIGIGSPRASLEANFALRQLVGPEHFHLGVSSGEQVLLEVIVDIVRHGPVRVASLREAEQADAVFVLGEDVSSTAPRLALSLRQAVRGEAFALADRLKIPRWQDAAVRHTAQALRSPLWVASFAPTRLDDVAAWVYRGGPEDLACLGHAVAGRINPAGFAATGEATQFDEPAAIIAKALQSAQRPLIVSGTGCQSLAVVQAAARIASALASQREGQPTAVHFAVPECNSLGLAMMGGLSLAEAFAVVEQGRAETVVVLENDLYRRAERPRVNHFLGKARHVVAIDHCLHETAQQAELLLAAASFAESEGTWVSSEGRAQRYFAVFPPPEGIQDSWRWLGAAAGKNWEGVDEVTRECAETLSVFHAITEAAPAAGLRIQGQKIPRQPHRYSGRTAMLAHVRIHEPKQPADAQSPLAFSMEGAPANRPAALNPSTWAPGWNSNQSVNKFQETIGGHLRGGDPGVRLIEPADAVGRLGFENRVGLANPATLQQAPIQPGRFRLVPLYHVFGSEELSMSSEALAQRAPAAYLALPPEDMAALGLAAGDAVKVNLPGGQRSLPVLPLAGLARGLAGLPAGLPGLGWIDFGSAFWEGEGAA